MECLLDTRLSMLSLSHEVGAGGAKKGTTTASS